MNTTSVVVTDRLFKAMRRLCYEEGCGFPIFEDLFTVDVDGTNYLVATDGTRLLGVRVGSALVPTRPDVPSLDDGPQVPYTRAFLSHTPDHSYDVALVPLRVWLGSPKWDQQCAQCKGDGCRRCDHAGLIFARLRVGWLDDVLVNRNLVAQTIDGLPGEQVSVGLTRFYSLFGKKNPISDQAKPDGIVIDTPDWRAVVMGMYVHGRFEPTSGEPHLKLSRGERP